MSLPVPRKMTSMRPVPHEVTARFDVAEYPMLLQLGAHAPYHFRYEMEPLLFLTKTSSWLPADEVTAGALASTVLSMEFGPLQPVLGENHLYSSLLPVVR